LGSIGTKGPTTGGPHGPYRQSERADLYARYAQHVGRERPRVSLFLLARAARGGSGRRRSRRVVRRATPARAGACRRNRRAERIAAGAKPALRFRIPDNHEVRFVDAVRGEVRFHTDIIGDPIIVRGQGVPAYNFAVVVDDALMAITHVIRGEDHISNTPRQILLYEALGFVPPAFAHLALVMGPDHTPLVEAARRDPRLPSFRSKGYLPEALVNYLALIGWSPGNDEELLPIAEMARRFSLDDVGVSAGVFDEEKLAWVNRHYLRLADPLRLAQLTLPYFAAAGMALTPDAEGMSFLASVMPVASGSVDRLDQVPARLSVVFAVLGRCGARRRGHSRRDDPPRRSRRGERARRGTLCGAAPRSRAFPRGGKRSEIQDGAEGKGALSTRFAWH
jgi:glutamyl/glutaminyl-tRNA synthetase